MAEQNIYQFLTAKCKEKGIKIEELPCLCGFSRSTLYRYMKGILYMSAEIEQKFADVLKLEGEDRAQLAILASLTAFDESTIEARHALDRFVFAGDEKPAAPKPIDFAYYHEDKYLRTADEIFDRVLCGAQERDYRCEVRVVNCMEPDMFAAVSAFLQRLLAASPASHAEQLITFSTEDHCRNIEMLFQALPLLRYSNYTIRYREAPKGNGRETLFQHAVLIRTTCGGQTEYHALSFMEGRLSTGFMTENRYFYEFIHENYEALREAYTTPLAVYAGVGDGLEEQLLALERLPDAFLLKQDMCYHMIPMEVYHNMASRLPQKTIDRIVAASFDKDMQPAARHDGLERLLDALAQRIEQTYHTKRTTVHSTEGLRAFACTGKLSDHLAAMPPFNREERRMTLENLRQRADDPNDPLALLITREALLADGIIIAGAKDQALYFSFAPIKGEPPRVPLLHIRSKELANTLSDYVFNHIPAQHAMTRDEARAFLDELIQSLS